MRPAVVSTLRLAAIAAGLALLLNAHAATPGGNPARQGYAAFQRGDYAEAATLFEQAWVSLRTTRGERHPETLAVMASLATTYGRLGRNEAQAEMAARVLERRTAVLGAEHPTTIESMGSLAWAYDALGRHAEAVTLMEKAVALRARSLGERHPDTLMAWNNLAVFYGHQGQHEREFDIHQAVLTARAEQLGERDPATLASMNNLAASAVKLQRLPQAVALAEKALMLRREVLGDRHPDTLRSINRLAQVYGALGWYAEQLDLQQSLLKVQTEVLGPLHPDTLATMNNVADAFGSLGQLGPALALHQKALALHTEVFGERHPSTLISTENVVRALGNLGRHEQALVLGEKVLKQRTEVLGERHPDTIASLARLGRTQGALGRSGQRLALAEKVLGLRSDIFGASHPQTLAAMADLAQSYAQLGRYADQLALSEKVLAIQRETLGERHPAIRVGLASLASSYAAVGRHADALPLQERLVQLQSEELGERHPLTLTAMNNLALTYGKLHRAPDQFALAEKVLRLRTETLGPRHPDTLWSMFTVASSHGANGRTVEQLALSQQTLALSTEVLGDQHPRTLMLLKQLAQGLVAAQRAGEAAALSARFVQGAELQRGQPGLSDDDRRNVFADYASTYRWFAGVHGRLQQQQQAFDLAELSKARTLLEGLAARRAGRAGALPAAEQDQLDGLSRQVATLDQAIAEAADTRARQPVEAARNEAVRKHAELTSRLRRQYPKFDQLSDVRILRSTDLPGLVPGDTVAVSYLVEAGSVQAFVIDDRGEPAWFDLGRVPALEQVVEILRLGHATPGGLAALARDGGRQALRLADGSYRLHDVRQPTPQGAVRIADTAEVVAWLSRRLLDPLGARLAAQPRWIVSPDGPLARLPFELMTLGGQRVLERAEVHYVQSLSVYALAREQQARYRSLARPRDLLALGDPSYGEAVASPAAKEAARGVTVEGVTQLRDLAGLWDPLPGTRQEVQALLRLFPDRSDSLFGQAASEQRLIELQDLGRLKDYRYIHLAAHGYLSPDQPALSSIVLSQSALPPGVDGFVTAAEWPGFDLRSDLTVLSACETGLGQHLGGEGVMGLPFALFVAGSSNTLLSLWPAFDESTAEFMAAFYGRLRNGDSIAGALTRTKREFARHPRWSHPGHWAAFVLIGGGG